MYYLINSSATILIQMLMASMANRKRQADELQIEESSHAFPLTAKFLTEPVTPQHGDIETHGWQQCK